MQQDRSKKRGVKSSLLLVFSIFLVSLFSIPVFSEVIINSRDWKDVYSGLQYGYLSGSQPYFLVSEKHGSVILNEIAPDADVEVLSSDKVPFVLGYESFLRDRGYNATELIFEILSLELAEKLSNINKYIILDDAYGYNAVAVAPYASKSKSYVIFADDGNIGQVVDFLDDKQPESIIIYGHVDRQVREQLARFNPDIINFDGDRFENNIEIVKRYKDITDATQVILTNGEFIESEIMSGTQPVLFIGNQNVPDKIKEYIRNSNIEVGVLIGNDLVGTATVVRRQVGISTFVKFARSARQPTGPISPVEGLDLFYVPKYPLDLNVSSIRYNAVTKSIEVTVQNNVDLASYFKGTYTITSREQVQTVGDLEPIFIDGLDSKTIVYDIDPIIDEGDISARAVVIYGESKGSLERLFEATFVVERVEILDDTAITIEKLVYNKGRNRFEISLKNIGEIDAYADTELIDILVIDERITIGGEEVIKIPVGKTKKSIAKVRLSDEDLENNELVKVRAYYGQNENNLVKIIEGDFEVIVKAFDAWTYVPVAIIIILILLILWKRKKKKKHHKHPSHN